MTQSTRVPQEIEELEAHVRRAPGSGEAWGSLGLAYRIEGAPGLAAEALGAAVRLAPDNAEYWHGLGMAQLDLDLAEEALRSGRRAVELAPRHPMAHVLLARALGRLGFCHRAIVHLEKATCLDPTWPAPLGDLGWAHLTLDEHRAAAEFFEAALRLDPEQLDLWAPWGACLLERRQAGRAVPVLETAVSLRPDDADSWARLGCALQQTGRSAEAATALLRGIELGCRRNWAWYWAGEAAAALGDREGLDRAHRELLAQDPERARDLEPRLRELGGERSAERASRRAG
ncbi:MAG TPA: tetratricopeptide repeat protein [Vicinamibacteria bacterium]